MLEGFVRYKDTKYFVNKEGKVIGPHKRILKHKGYLKEKKYICVHIKDKNVLLHRMVAEIFIPNPNNLPVVNHIDGNKLNNNINNLCWTTYSENTNHAYKTLNFNPCKKKVSVYKDDEFIGIFNSIKEASEFTGVKQSGISRNLIDNIQNKKRYIFKYLDI